MRWYSVKKYKPACVDAEMFVRNENRIFVAKLESDSMGFRDCDGCYFEDERVPTHFCIPDPIPMDDEE